MMDHRHFVPFGSPFNTYGGPKSEMMAVTFLCPWMWQELFHFPQLKMKENLGGCGGESVMKMTGEKHGKQG